MRSAVLWISLLLFTPPLAATIVYWPFDARVNRPNEYLEEGSIIYPTLDLRHRSGNNWARDNAQYQNTVFDFALPVVTSVDSTTVNGWAPGVKWFSDRADKYGERTGLLGGIRFWELEMPVGYSFLPILRRPALGFLSASGHAGYVRNEHSIEKKTSEGLRIETEGNFAFFLLGFSATPATEFYGDGRFDEFDASINIPKPICPVAISLGFRYQHGLGFTMRGWLIGFEISF